MKRFIYFALILLSIDASAQSRKTATEQTDLRPTVLNKISRTEQFTYSYIEVDGEKIFDGPFTFVANGDKAKAYEKVTGQFKNGAMDGVWTWTVKFTDILLPTYEHGRYLTMDATMTRRYSAGIAEGEWECSYVSKRRDIIFDMKTRTNIPKDYIKSLEEHYDQKATFHDNRLTIERDGDKVIDGVFYNESDAKYVIVNHQQHGIPWEEYLNYARRLDPVEAANILSDLSHRNGHYVDCGNERMCIKERPKEPKIYETELLNGAGLLFSPLWNYGTGFQTSILTPTFTIEYIDTIREYNETEITEYLKKHSSSDFQHEYLIWRAYKTDDYAKLKEAYEKKREEEAEISRKQHELFVFKEDNRLFVGSPNMLNFGSFVLAHPQIRHFNSFYNKENGSVVAFLEPKLPEGWTSKWEGSYNDGIMTIRDPKIEGFCTEIKNAFMNASTLEEAHSIYKEWEDAENKYREFAKRLSDYKKVVDYYISFPVAELFNKKDLSAFMKQHGIDNPDEAAALYFIEGAPNESYSTMYWAFMKIKNDINPSDFQTETEYYEYYYSEISKLAKFCVNENKAKRMKTPEELLQAASVSLK